MNNKRRILLLLAIIIFLILPTVSATTTVFTMPDANDGTFQNSTTAACEGRLWKSYATVQPLGSGGYSGPRLTATTTSGQCNANRRFFWSVPTGDIPDGDTIDSAKFCFMGRYTSGVSSKSNGLGSPDFTIIGFTPAGFPIAASDSATNGTTEYISKIAYANMPGNNASVCVDFNAAGVSAISKTGNTSFLGVFRDWDLFGNSVGYTWASSGNSNFYLWDSYYGNPWGANLTVTYHTPDTTPPESLSNFANITTCLQTNISWANPLDTDFNHTYTKWNNVWVGNLTNTTTWYNVSGLSESTEYTLSTNTCDLVGNCNTTTVDYAVKTSACGSAPVAAFAANNLSFCQGTNTQFTDESSNVPTGWTWIFGDGNTSTDQNPLKTYDVIGSMTVKLTASNSYGSDDEEKTGYITVEYCAPQTPTPTPTPAPFQSIFTSNATCGNIPFNVTFTDTSIGANITNWKWEFGDGNTSVLENDINQYSQMGLYTVNHYIDDGIGNYSWDNRTDMIRAYPDWIPCSSGSDSGNNRVDVETDLPLPIYIPILSAGLALIAWRRKFRM